MLWSGLSRYILREMQEKDAEAVEMQNALKSLEDKLELTKTTIEENDTELKVKRCYGYGMRHNHCAHLCQ